MLIFSAEDGNTPSDTVRNLRQSIGVKIPIRIPTPKSTAIVLKYSHLLSKKGISADSAMHTTPDMTPDCPSVFP